MSETPGAFYRELERLEERVRDAEEAARAADERYRFTESRLSWLVGPQGNNGVVSQLKNEAAHLRREVDALKETKFRAFGALAAMTVIAAGTATIAALLMQVFMRGGS
jgi:hypothetical protein